MSGRTPGATSVSSRQGRSRRSCACSGGEGRGQREAGRCGRGSGGTPPDRGSRAGATMRPADDDQARHRLGDRGSRVGDDAASRGGRRGRRPSRRVKGGRRSCARSGRRRFRGRCGGRRGNGLGAVFGAGAGGGGLSLWAGGILRKSFRPVRGGARRCGGGWRRTPRFLASEADAETPARITLRRAERRGRIFPRVRRGEIHSLPKARNRGKLIYIVSIEIL